MSIVTVTSQPYREADMCYLNLSVLLFTLLFFNIHALNCRSDGGPKGSELKAVYSKCLKMQDGKNFTSYHDRSGDHDLKDNRRNQRNNWERDQMGNDRDRKRDNRNDRSDRRNNDGRMSYDERPSNYDERKSSHGDSMSSYNDRMGSYDRMDNYDSRKSNGDSRMDSYGRDSMNNHDSRYNRDSLNGRNDFQHDDMGSDMNDQYAYSTQSTRRYKRKTENSGQRSQFNPNTSRKSSGSDDSYRSDERNSNDNGTSKEDEKKACALHCFLENLEMTAEDGMPDRYLVTHTLTKDVTNEDLKDFLQESIEECFQILDNENTEDKCEYSKNLLTCLSEKGRANCDDWKDDLRF